MARYGCIFEDTESGDYVVCAGGNTVGQATDFGDALDCDEFKFDGTVRFVGSTWSVIMSDQHKARDWGGSRYTGTVASMPDGQPFGFINCDDEDESGLFFSREFNPSEFSVGDRVTFVSTMENPPNRTRPIAHDVEFLDE